MRRRSQHDVIANTVELVEILQRLLRERGLHVTDLHIVTEGKLGKSALPLFFGGHRSLSLDTLDVVTEALDMQKGAFYRYYYPECFKENGDLLPKKAMEYVIRCFEANETQNCDSMMDRISDLGRNYSEKIFWFAERLHKIGRKSEAIRFYNTAISMEREKANNTESDILALSYYRIFLIFRDVSFEEANDYCVHLIGYLRSFPTTNKFIDFNFPFDSTDLKVDCYFKIISFFFVQEKWQRVKEFSLELIEYTKENDDLVHAYGRALVYLGQASYYLKDYDYSLQLIDEYMHLPSNEDYRFKEWGTANRFIVLIESTRDMSLLRDYLVWLEQNPHALVPNISFILSTYVDNQMFEEVGELFEKYQTELEQYSKKLLNPWEKRQLIRIDLCKVKYYFHKQENSIGFDILLRIIENSVTLKLPAYFFECLSYFIEQVEKSTIEQRELLKEFLDAAPFKFG